MTVPATPFGDRLMLGRGLLDGGADAAVAAETDAVTGSTEQTRLVAAVGNMAIIAAPSPYRTMHPAGCADFTMTGAAERTLFGNEQMGLGGTVGCMAGQAAPFSHRRMGMGFTGGDGNMATLAEPGAGFFQDKSGRWSGMGRAGLPVAGEAIAGSDRRVRNRSRGEGGMARGGHTALVGACGISPAQRRTEEKRAENSQQPKKRQQTPSQAKDQLDEMLSRR